MEARVVSAADAVVEPANVERPDVEPADVESAVVERRLQRPVVERLLVGLLQERQVQVRQVLQVGKRLGRCRMGRPGQVVERRRLERAKSSAEETPANMPEPPLG